jgi:hypothetical protein
MPGFRQRRGEEWHGAVARLVPTGYYSFMDYAIGYWVRHLEAGLTDGIVDDESLRDLSEAIDIFLQWHFTPPVKGFQVSKGNAHRMRFFEGSSFHHDLQQAVISTRKQLTFDREMAPTEILLDLGEMAIKVHAALEDFYRRVPKGKDREKFEQLYGLSIFKCPSLSCRAFQNGFSTAKSRDQHIDKHTRPFRCTVVGCPKEILGFSTTGELEKHKKETHMVNEDSEYFPSEAEIFRVDENQDQQTENQPQTLRALPSTIPEQDNVDRTPNYNSHSRRPKISVFPCPSCPKVFKRKYNLESHSITHSDLRPHSCSICGDSFARLNDLSRHERSHQPKQFVCKGKLKNGQDWGCRKMFARLDTLKSHHKSAIGQACILPLLKEQENEVLGEEHSQDQAAQS